MSLTLLNFFGAYFITKTTVQLFNTKLWQHAKIQKHATLVSHSPMTTADAIYELVNQLPEEQAKLVWLFAQFIQQNTQASSGKRVIPTGTLTSLRGIAKQATMQTDQELTDSYTDYLIQKYQ